MDETFTELRRHSPSVRELLSHVDARIAAAKDRLAQRLLNERESDMLRGRIAELKNLSALVKNTGEADE